MPRICFIAWIPILTKQINFRKRVEEFILHNKNVTQINENLFLYRFKYSDNIFSCKSESFKLKFDNFGLLRQIYLKKGNKEILLANIKYYSKGAGGLVFFSLHIPSTPTESIKDRLKILVFTILKDIYHVHTHHKADEDILIEPVEVDCYLKRKTIEKGVEIILNQFQEKIIYHMKSLQQIQNASYRKDFENFLEILKKAKGEMIYALNLISNFERTFCTNRFSHCFSTSFENSIRALDIMQQYISNKSYQFSLIVGILSLLLTIFTLAINYSNGIYNHTKQNFLLFNNLVLGFILGTLLLHFTSVGTFLLFILAISLVFLFLYAG